MAKHREDGALDDLNADLDLGLVAGGAHTRGDHGDAVMGGQVLIGRIEVGLVAMSSGDAAFEIIRHYDVGYAAEELEGPGVGADPIRQRLRPRRFGIGVVGGAQHGDEDLRLTHLAGRECLIFCVSVIWSMLSERSKDYDNFPRTTGRAFEGLRAA